MAKVTNQEAEYTKLKGFDDQYYRDLIVKALEQHGELKRADFDKLLLNKLPEVLSDDQKIRKIGNLLAYLRKQGKIKTGKNKTWQLEST